MSGGREWKRERGAIFMKRLFAVLILLLVATAVAAAQELVVRGPLGTPIGLMDEFGHMKNALEIYSTPDVDTFIPDISDGGWEYWFGESFRKTGRYSIYIYLAAT